MRFRTVSRVFSKVDLYTCAEMISKEGHIPLKDLIRSLEHFFSETGEDQVRVMYSVPVDGEDLPICGGYGDATGSGFGRYEIHFCERY